MVKGRGDKEKRKERKGRREEERGGWLLTPSTPHVLEIPSSCPSLLCLALSQPWVARGESAGEEKGRGWPQDWGNLANPAPGRDSRQAPL